MSRSPHERLSTSKLEVASDCSPMSPPPRRPQHSDIAVTKKPTGEAMGTYRLACEVERYDLCVTLHSRDLKSFFCLLAASIDRLITDHHVSSRPHNRCNWEARWRSGEKPIASQSRLHNPRRHPQSQLASSTKTQNFVIEYLLGPGRSWRRIIHLHRRQECDTEPNLGRLQRTSTFIE